MPSHPSQTPPSSSVRNTYAMTAAKNNQGPSKPLRSLSKPTILKTRGAMSHSPSFSKKPLLRGVNGDDETQLKHTGELEQFHPLHEIDSSSASAPTCTTWNAEIGVLFFNHHDGRRIHLNSEWCIKKLLNFICGRSGKAHLAQVIMKFKENFVHLVSGLGGSRSQWSAMKKTLNMEGYCVKYIVLIDNTVHLILTKVNLTYIYPHKGNTTTTAKESDGEVPLYGSPLPTILVPEALATKRLPSAQLLGRYLFETLPGPQRRVHFADDAPKEDTGKRVVVVTRTESEQPLLKTLLLTFDRDRLRVLQGQAPKGCQELQELPADSSQRPCPAIKLSYQNIPFSPGGLASPSGWLAESRRQLRKDMSDISERLAGVAGRIRVSQSGQWLRDQSLQHRPSLPTSAPTAPAGIISPPAPALEPLAFPLSPLSVPTHLPFSSKYSTITTDATQEKAPVPSVPPPPASRNYQTGTLSSLRRMNVRRRPPPNPTSIRNSSITSTIASKPRPTKPTTPALASSEQKLHMTNPKRTKNTDISIGMVRVLPTRTLSLRSPESTGDISASPGRKRSYAGTKPGHKWAQSSLTSIVRTTKATQPPKARHAQQGVGQVQVLGGEREGNTSKRGYSPRVEQERGKIGGAATVNVGRGSQSFAPVMKGIGTPGACRDQTPAAKKQGTSPTFPAKTLSPQPKPNQRGKKLAPGSPLEVAHEKNKSLLGNQTMSVPESHLELSPLGNGSHTGDEESLGKGRHGNLCFMRSTVSSAKRAVGQNDVVHIAVKVMCRC